MHIQATGRAPALPKFNKLGPISFGASLVLGAYVLLHTAAHNERLSGDATGTLGSGLVHGLLSAAASMAPMALLIVGLQTMLNLNDNGARITRRSRLSVVAALTVTDIDQLVGDLYRKQGYTVIENRGHLSDGGVDLVLRDGQTTIYAITRHLRDRRIEIGQVRALFSAMKGGAATGGVVVSSGRFSPEAKSFAALSGIRLIDSKTLDRLVRGE